MPFCKKCGNILEEDVVFCPKCGMLRLKTSKTSQSFPLQDSSDFDKTVKRTEPVYGVLNLENLPEGHVIDDRYEIKEKLGQGSFGAIYSEYDKKLEIDKAIKVIPEANVNDLEAMENLRAEAKTMLKLNHPHIVRVYDFH